MAITVDSHHHFWDTSNADYDYYWMTDDLMVIQGKRRPEDLRPWINAKGIDKTVIVQTIPSVAETIEFLETAVATDFVAGVVGWVDLMDPAVGETLAELQARPDGEYLVSIRHQVHDEPDPDWLDQPEVQRGIAAVGAAGLAYDLLLKSPELPSGLRTVEAHRDMRFVVDHIAKPDIAAGEIEPWFSRMKPLSHHPNVWVKVSGMITEADHYNWKPDDIKPYVQMLLEWFGPRRLMFGSDWPVCMLAGTYSQVYDTAVYALGELSDADRAAVFGGNAIEAYQLPVEA